MWREVCATEAVGMVQGDLSQMMVLLDGVGVLVPGPSVSYSDYAHLPVASMLIGIVLVQKLAFAVKPGVPQNGPHLTLEYPKKAVLVTVGVRQVPLKKILDVEEHKSLLVRRETVFPRN